jgi:aconitate hydratase
VKTSLAPGSKAVQLYLEEAGLLPELEKLGFGIVAFACTTCNGMSGALDPKIQQEIIDRDLYATAVLSGNRNFDGRIHPYAKQAFLASPPLVVAYAIAGTIRFDIEKDVLGVDATARGAPEGHLAERRRDRRDRAASVKPEQFRKVYEPMFARRRRRRASAPLYDWRPQSTYIRRPPYWEGALAGERTLRACAAGGARRQHHHRPPVAVERDPRDQRGRRIPGEDGPAGRRLQLLRHAPRRPPDRAARHLRQPDAVNEMAVVDGAVKKARWRASSPKARSCACGKRSKPT